MRFSILRPVSSSGDQREHVGVFHSAPDQPGGRGSRLIGRALECGARNGRLPYGFKAPDLRSGALSTVISPYEIRLCALARSGRFARRPRNGVTERLLVKSGIFHLVKHFSNCVGERGVPVQFSVQFRRRAGLFGNALNRFSSKRSGNKQGPINGPVSRAGRPLK
jgi:hypothetical protein